MPASPTQPAPVRCRQIGPADLEAVADLLARGFPAKPRKYWTTALERLARRGAPEGRPRFGYLLEADGAVVGVLLLIFSGSAGRVRCNISSWYVEPEHRGHAAQLARIATRQADVTYLNVSAARHTWPILEAQGYRRYSEGQFLGLAVLSPARGRKARALCEADRSLADYDLLRAHADAGCHAVVCDTPDGPAPFLFLRRRVERLPFPVMQLIYERDSGSLVACAGAVGRFILAQGAPAVLCDATGPVPGLVGVFFKDRTPRYFKGPERPALNDLSFTEMVVFGP
ncbi:MAG: hypothetical protein ACREEW_09080 [Caulobacteraceae bacterium]